MNANITTLAHDFDVSVWRIAHPLPRYRVLGLIRRNLLHSTCYSFPSGGACLAPDGLVLNSFVPRRHDLDTRVCSWSWIQQSLPMLHPMLAQLATAALAHATSARSTRYGAGLKREQSRGLRKRVQAHRRHHRGLRKGKRSAIAKRKRQRARNATMAHAMFAAS